MTKWLLIALLLVAPVFAQRARVNNRNAFRSDLAAAVGRGNLNAEEKQKYEDAIRVLDAQRAAHRNGTAPDRTAVRGAMKDLAAIARSSNLTEDDRAKLAKDMKRARGKGVKRRAPAPAV